jgi:hypothetical protein
MKKIRHVGTELFHADGQKDLATSRFMKFCKTAWEACYRFHPQHSQIGIHYLTYHSTLYNYRWWHSRHVSQTLSLLSMPRYEMRGSLPPYCILLWLSHTLKQLSFYFRGLFYYHEQHLPKLTTALHVDKLPLLQTFKSSQCTAQNPLFLPVLLWSELHNGIPILYTPQRRLRWSRSSVLAFGTQDRGFTPGRSRRIFRTKKILSTPSVGGEVKPSVSCRSFTAWKIIAKGNVEVRI